MQESKVGRIAALVAAVLYVLSAIHLAIGTYMTLNDDTPGDDDNGAMFLIWGILVFVATIAAAVALYSLLKRSGLHKKGLGLAAVVVGVLAAIVSFFCWLWPVWGILLGVAFLLGALVLRKQGAGLIGFPSSWDWTILGAWVVGTLVTYILYWTDTVEVTDDLEWAYTSGYAIGALVTAITLVQVASSLKTPAPVVVETIEPTDGPGVAGI